MKITICGGGALGHVCIGVLSAHKDVSVSLLTDHPNQWQSQVTIIDINGKNYLGRLDKISSRPEDVIPQADIVLLCLPGFLIEEKLKKIKNSLSPKSIVGSIVCSTGFFFFAHNILGDNAKLFGFQRVPFIARIFSYGKEASLLGYKKSLAIAAENVDENDIFCSTISKLFKTKTSLLHNFYEASLTNSNPILHTGRLYSMWHDWNGETLPNNILFYKEWTTEAAQLLIDMDNEFMQLLSKLPVRKNAIPSLLDYYESYNAESLTAKLKSINAFQNILAPMKQSGNGWVPDFTSRYFTEDFPFGLKFIVDLAKQHNVSTPVINRVYTWGMQMCEKL